MNREMTGIELLDKAPAFDRDIMFETKDLALDDFSSRSSAFTPWATKQLCTTMGIPYSYYKKCPSYLQHDMMNYWLVQKNKKVVLRQSLTQNIAVLSPRYHTISHDMVLRTVADNIPSNWTYWPIETGYDLRFYALAPSINGSRIGLYIQNSIIGHASLSVWGCIFKIVCSNGLIVPLSNQQIFRTWHTRKDLKQWFKAVLTSANITNFVGLSDILDKSDRYLVLEPKAQEILSQSKLSKEIQKKYLKSVAGTQRNYFHLINFLSSKAQEFPPTRRVELEQFAGNLLQSLVYKGKLK